ncbi:MAG TPA: M56 family metallopeptidase [Bryobacteraceae bacterium]|nr:M56 family metallopeptidase [Bryobacteraceae bacterium]
MTTSFIINHLWQSSCFALLAGLLALVLRKNSPKVRYWVWLSASLKFLLPLALLVSLGSVVPRPAPQPLSVAAPAFPSTLVQIAEPFPPAPRDLVPAHTPRYWVSVAIGAVWALGFLAIMLARCRSWLGVRAALRAATPIELPIPVRALITPGAEEPGIVGFLFPVLVLPAPLLEHLNSRQLNAILTHELCHVRRRDNLFAAVHMVVEAIFWFDPLVWWIGSRMVEERELACDEEVLRMGCEPADYVQGILKVCRFYMESPLPCISGVTGADVKKRLRAILAGCIAHELSGAKKMTLVSIGVATLAAPVLVGLLTPGIAAQDAPAATPKFEVVSIKPCQYQQEVGGMYPPRINSSPGRLGTGCYPLLDEHGLGLIANAYRSTADRFTPINGGPSWIHAAFYEINAKAEGNPSARMMMGPMMRVLLEDRFQLKVHRQTGEGPVYFLTVARGGLKLHAFTEGSCTPYYSSDPPPRLQPGQKYCMSNISAMSPPSVELQGATLDEFSKVLRQVLDRPVIDKTGIAGRFDIRVEFSREETKMAGMPLMRDGAPAQATEPTGTPLIFTALQEQLGLRLEPVKGPVDVFVIDHIERPAEN